MEFLIALFLSWTIFTTSFEADDFGWGDVSMHGSGAIQTPNLDGLAKGGINLTHYYTQHICTPTRSSLLSSRYPIHTGLQTNVIAVSQPSGLHKNETLFPEYMEGMIRIKYCTSVVTQKLCNPT